MRSERAKILKRAQGLVELLKNPPKIELSESLVSPPILTSMIPRKVVTTRGAGGDYHLPARIETEHNKLIRTPWRRTNRGQVVLRFCSGRRLDRRYRYPQGGPAERALGPSLGRI